MSIIRQRTKNLIVAGVIGAVAMGLVSSGGAVFMYKQQEKEQKKIRSNYEQRLQDAEKLILQEQAVKKRVVVSTGKVEAGEKLTKDHLKTIEIAETDAPANMIQNIDDLVGKIVKIEVGQNTPIISSMVFEEAPTPIDLRLHEYNVMILPTKLQIGQFVDVRITFPTGEDFVVLSKKKVLDMSGTTVWYNINESELLVMSSAIVDAYLHGAKLYAITYVDPFLQDKATPNYPVNLKVIDLIESDPNVLEKASGTLRSVARKALENNLSKITDEERMKIQNGGLILQQDIANNQTTNQQNNQSVDGSQSNPDASDQKNSDQNSINQQTQTSGSSENDSIVPKDQIVQPAGTLDDEDANKQKQQDVFEQPLIK